jgi:hypothetical protein
MLEITKACESSFVMTSVARHLLFGRTGNVVQIETKSRSLATLVMTS